MAEPTEPVFLRPFYRIKHETYTVPLEKVLNPTFHWVMISEHGSMRYSETFTSRDLASASFLNEQKRAIDKDYPCELLVIEQVGASRRTFLTWTNPNFKC